MAPLFSADQLRAHEGRWWRLWHIVRRPSPVGWRTLADTATFTGTVVRGEADADGDTNFDLFVLPFLTLHCEIDPADLDRLRPDLATLEAGQRVSVTGKFVVDLGHGSDGGTCQLELHPVTQIVAELWV